LNTSPDIILIKPNEDKMDGACGMHRENRNIYRVLAGKSGGPPGIPIHRWKDNIKMYFNDRGWEVVDWIHPDQDLQVP
jgi:hypothetical protein